MRIRLACALVATLFLAQSAAASERVSGSFTATRTCEAYKSIRNKTNPGAAKTTPGTTYNALEVNSRDWRWIRIEVPGVTDGARWVARDCGNADIGEVASRSSGAGKQCNIKNQHDSYVLAMSWQPGFCEHVRYEGKKPECDALAQRRLDIDHLTLHGLWPNKKSCGTKYGSCGGDPLQLEQSTVEKIAPWMPNFYYETNFGRHEWEKHGTCQNLPDDDYFLTAVNAVKLVNDSAVGRYIHDNLGKRISVKSFFAHVTEAHGEQVARRITLICSQSRYLQEIRLALPVDFRTDGGIEQLASGAAQSVPMTSKCGSDKIYIERAGPD